jgi:hypothetical protein
MPHEHAAVTGNAEFVEFVRKFHESPWHAVSVTETVPKLR